jgi:hypothetical protein
MSKKSDDSIERIFRQALTHYETTFRESDWLKMEKMLDEEAVRMALVRSKRIKGIGFALTGLTVLFIAVYFLAFNPSDSTVQLDHPATEMQAGDELSNNGNVETENSSNSLLSPADSVNSDSGEKNENTDQKEVNILSGKTSDEATNKSPKDTDSRKAIRKSDLPQRIEGTEVGKSSVLNEHEKQTGPSTASRRTAKREQIDPPVIKNVEDPSSKNASATDDNSELPKKSSNNGNRVDEIKSSQQLKLNEKNNPSAGNIEKRTDESNSQSEQEELAVSDNIKKSVEPISPEQTDSLTSGPSEHKVTPQLLAERKDQLRTAGAVEDSRVDSVIAKKVENSDSIRQDQSFEESRKDKVKPNSRWSIGIVFTPEFSTTRLDHYSTPGESIGLRIGYQISSRFQINTGIIRSNKRYKDSGSEYNTNPNYWNNRTNGVIPEEIDGRCLVYEIPLGVQFDVISREESRVFVSTAISNYIMVSQSYDYWFDQPNPGADTNWQTSRTDKYWFGVGVFSAGYERHLSRSIALGIEPYLKTSLTEIGWPNIKLFSAGAYITLRYRFITKDKQLTK